MKPKLADGSRWEGCSVATGLSRTSIDVSVDRGMLLLSVGGDALKGCYIADALAVIRAAGLDKVWAAAVELRKEWSAHNPLMDSSQYKDVVDAISELCRAVEESSELKT